MKEYKVGKAKPYFREYLNTELESRTEDNENYSLRAFAKFLEIDPSLLLRIMTGKQSLSLNKAQEIAEKLKLDQEEREKFVVSVADSYKCKSLKRIDSSFTDCEEEC